MYSKEIAIPEGTTIDINGTRVQVSGPKGRLEKEFKISEIKIEKSEKKVKAFSESERRKVKSVVGTVVAHIRNMFEGVKEGYTYKLKVVFSHFPVTVKTEGNKILIQNFLGERTPRVAKIVGNSKVEIKDQDITITGIDLEEVSQTSGNIEQACRVIGYDRRRFPDGIFITSKGD
jgi:large subunit ribosomal protein L6